MRTDLEVTTESRRNFVAVVYTLCYPVGGILAALAGQWMSAWRTMLFWSALAATFTVPLFVLLPESPRWLIANEKYERAKKVLRRAAWFNGRPLPTDLDLKSMHDQHVRPTERIGQAEKRK